MTPTIPFVEHGDRGDDAERYATNASHCDGRWCFADACAGNHFKVGRKGGHDALELIEFAAVSIKCDFALRGQLFKAGLTTHHAVEVFTVYGDGEIRVFRLLSLDVGEGAVAHFDHEVFAVIRCFEIDDELHVAGLGAVHADSQGVKPEFGGHGFDHVRAAGFRRGTRWYAMTQFVGCAQEAVTNAGAFFLVTDLFVYIGEKIFGLCVVGLGVNQFVQNLHGFAVFALFVELLAFGDNLARAAHHADIERGRFTRRQRNEVGGVGIPVTQVAVDNSPAVVRF